MKGRAIREQTSHRIVISHPGSPIYARHDVLALDQHEMLEYFATTYVGHPEYWLSRLLRSTAKRLKPTFERQLDRRAFDEVPFARVRTRSGLELLRTLCSAVVKSPVLADLVWELEERDFDSWVARSLPRSVTAVYTFEHAALATLGVAKRQGQYSFLEVPAQHSEFYRRIHDRQLERYPELRNSVTAIQEGSRSRRRMRRKMAELAAANCILCNSSFTKRTLIEARVASDKIEVTPYGFPPPAEAPVSQDGPVIFLNAGTQDLRKGIHLLYQAWRRLNLDPSQGELWLIGKMQLPESLRADLPGVVRCMNSIPHTELLSTYRRASVFVLPSLADGFGLVATEAMSQGLPVIITTSTGAADVIEHGRNGFVIPSDDVDALEAQMRWCIEHRQQLTGIGGRALDTARSWQWSDYRDSLARTIQQRLDAASDLLHRQRSVPAFDGVN